MRLTILALTAALLAPAAFADPVSLECKATMDGMTFTHSYTIDADAGTVSRTDRNGTFAAQRVAITPVVFDFVVNGQRIVIDRTTGVLKSAVVDMTCGRVDAPKVDVKF